MTKRTPDISKWRPATRLVRGGLDRTAFSETAEALFMTSGYVYGSAEEAEESFDGTRERYVYSRFNNPTLSVFERRLAALEGARFCKSTASGMAAVHAALVCGVKAGDRVVGARALFGSCLYILTDILPRMGVEVELVDGKDLVQWQAALSRPAQLVFLETPSNPTLEIIDIAAVSALAHSAGARVVVDNVFATPLYQKPLELGADVVVYSATKHMDGQGRCLGGAILSNDEQWVTEVLGPYLRHTGPTLSPFNAWVLAKGLETMELRVSRQVDNALAIARALEAEAAVSRVLYPFLDSHPQHALARSQMGAGGTMVAFELAGGKEAAYRLLNKLAVIDISNNLGDAKSLITHLATTTHQRLSPDEKAKMGITDGLLRLSVGIEDISDLLDDIKSALVA